MTIFQKYLHLSRNRYGTVKFNVLKRPFPLFTDAPPVEGMVNPDVKAVQAVPAEGIPNPDVNLVRAALADGISNPDVNSVRAALADGISNSDRAALKATVSRLDPDTAAPIVSLMPVDPNAAFFNWSWPENEFGREFGPNGLQDPFQSPMTGGYRRSERPPQSPADPNARSHSTGLGRKTNSVENLVQTVFRTPFSRL